LIQTRNGDVVCWKYCTGTVDGVLDFVSHRAGSVAVDATVVISDPKGDRVIQYIVCVPMMAGTGLLDDSCPNAVAIVSTRNYNVGLASKSVLDALVDRLLATKLVDDSSIGNNTMKPDFHFCFATPS
jgi:hypothetical protein